jgi:hypothetical protein
MAIMRNLPGSMALEESHRIRRRASRYGATGGCGYAFAFDSSEAILFQLFTQSHPFQTPFKDYATKGPRCELHAAASLVNPVRRPGGDSRQRVKF